MGAIPNNNFKYPARLEAPYNYGDCSYVHSVLQSLLMHPIMKEAQNIFNNGNMNLNNIRLTNEMLNLYNKINQNSIANSKNIIDLFFIIANENVNNFGDNFSRVTMKDPYHFLFWVLYFFHKELNNSPKNFDLNRLKNILLPIKSNENLMQSLFGEYLVKMHNNSVIFQYFFFVERQKYLCNNCGTYYDFNINHIFSMNVDNILNYKKKKYQIPGGVRTIINLDDCFDYYCNNNYDFCEYCKLGINQYKKIYNRKSLIIRFKRNCLGEKCDVDFPIPFDFSNYSALKEGDMKYHLYVLKSCISFNKKSGKYFADINVDVNNNTGIWVRYTDSGFTKLNSSNEVKSFEPQLLIYELKTLEQNNNNNLNINNNHQNSNNNNNNNNENNNLSINDIFQNENIQNFPNFVVNNMPINNNNFQMNGNFKVYHMNMPNNNNNFN